MIHLHTLGDTLITVGEKEIRPTSPVLFAALLYLGIERGRRVPRAALQELLFPEADERSGAHSLRQLLYKLRQLGAPLDVDAASVAIQAELVHDDSAADSGTNGRGNGHADGFEKRALGFLPDYQPKLSDRYTLWLENKRSSVTATVRRQLLAALSASREAINWQAVERFAQLILAIDPFNEEATLALAEATALSGGKAEALGILARYEHETGRADLRLPSSLLRRRISEAVSDKGTRAPNTPFVGREADAEALRHQAALARTGKPSLVVLAGEAGIGKSRLLEEAASLATIEGTQVHIVRCQSHYSSRPLSAFIELVPALLSSRGALGVSQQSLAHLKFLTSHADDGADRPTDARDDSTRSGLLLASLRDLVDAVAAEVPLLIAIEDAHWADADSLRELSFLVQGPSRRSLLVIYTTRYLETLRTAGVLDDGTIVRKLKPLASQPMDELAKHLLPQSSSAQASEVAAWCVQTAAGNPLFLQMLCAHYGETAQPFSVPPDLMSATTRRIEQLPQACRRILEFGALLGRHSTIDALRSLTECTQLQLLNTVQRLEEEGYLRIDADAVRVSHDLLSECTLGLVPPIARRVLHSCVATHLEQRYDATHDASLLWDCAEHWSSSGEAEKALQFLMRCARHASQIGRASLALSLLERAKQLARGPGETSEVLDEMMVTAKAAGQWADVYEFSKQLARLPADAVEVAPHAAGELVSIEAEWVMLSEYTSIATLFGCVSAQKAPSKHRIDAALLLLKMAHEMGDSELATRAYAAVEPLLDAHSVNYSNRIVPIIYHTTFGDRDLALILTRRLASELASVESVGGQFRAASNVAMALGFLGASDESLALTHEYYERARALGMTAWRVEFCYLTCSVYLITHRFDKVEAFMQSDGLNPRQAPRTGYGRMFSGPIVEIALRKGDAKIARECLDDLTSSGFGNSLRGKTYLSGVEIRLKQLDQQFDCGDKKLDELYSLYHATKTLLTADSVALAIGEAIKRRGKRLELRQLLDDYRKARRERTPLGPDFADLLTFCSENG